ncbi:MAG: hypothetical protein PF495_08525, partial [Spirochaetales bacterium]|nr:hypothetical protein [Spirochaetales bacterium]
SATSAAAALLSEETTVLYAGQVTGDLLVTDLLLIEGSNGPCISTSGRTAIGDGGGGTFIWDSSDLSTEVTADTESGIYVAPTSDLTGATGAWVRQFDALRPQYFGAVADSAIDSYTSLQAFFDFADNYDVGSAEISGSYGISQGLVYGSRGPSPAATQSFFGTVRFVALNAIDIMMWFGLCPGLSWEGKVKVYGTGGLDWGGRTCRVGVKTGGGSYGPSRMTISGITAWNFYDTGVALRTQSTLADMGDIRARFCASGHAGQSLLTEWSNPVNNGSVNSLNQDTTVDVTILPPDDGETLQFLVVDNVPHAIENVDRVNNKVTVFPWIPDTAVPSEVAYMFGGGIYIQGADAGIIGLNQVDVQNCGIGLWQAALYGPIVNRLVAQSCGAGFICGYDKNSAFASFTLNGFYSEGNELNIVKNSVASPEIHGGVIISSYETGINEKAIVNAAASATLNNFNNITMINAGAVHEWQGYGSNLQETASSLNLPFAGSKPKHQIYRKDWWDVNVGTPDLDLNRLYGYGHDTVTFLGETGITPTGSFVFHAPSGFTVNGLADVTFSDFSGPAIFHLYLEVSALDIIIECESVSKYRIKTATTAELEAIANNINTSSLKMTGQEVFNTSTSKPVWSLGSSSTSAWVDATGATVYTPA